MQKNIEDVTNSPRDWEDFWYSPAEEHLKMLQTHREIGKTSGTVQKRMEHGIHVNLNVSGWRWILLNH